MDRICKLRRILVKAMNRALDLRGSDVVMTTFDIPLMFTEKELLRQIRDWRALSKRFRWNK